ncbi:MAG: Verru_Chthon cassette protein B [Chthoniobacteraceae bacterium]
MDTSRPSDRKLKLSQRKSAGFSLVEVTMAIGVFGFAFAAIMGLIPMGLSTFRQAMDASVGTQICQRVINDIQQTDYDTLTGNSLDDRYFDEAGNEVAKTSKYIYQVKTVVSATTSAPNAEDTFLSLATVLVQIASNPGHLTPGTDPDTGAWRDTRLSISAYPCLVSRNKYTAK